MIKNKAKLLWLLTLFGAALAICFVATETRSKHDPVIAKLNAVADTLGQQVVVTFDLLGAAGDEVDVRFAVVDSAGNADSSPPGEVSGDTGSSVAPGKNRKIVWRYRDKKQVRRSKIKISVANAGGVDVEKMVHQVDSLNLKKMLSNIYGNRNRTSPAGRAHLQQVQQVLGNHFKANGLHVQRQEFTYNGYTGCNIIAKIPGRSAGSKTYVLCAHYDTVADSPGADDNGSGIAGMLEVMRVLSKYEFKHSIVFAAFDMEEDGSVGSGQYVLTAKNEPKQPIQGIINFDMIGAFSNEPNSQNIPPDFDRQFPDVYQSVVRDEYRARFVLNVGNQKSADLTAAFSRSGARYVPGLKILPVVVEGNGENYPEFASSDHAAFWMGGYKAIHIGDGGNTRNEHMDSEHDQLHLVNYPFMANIVRATVATLAELAEVQDRAGSLCEIQNDGQ